MPANVVRTSSSEELILNTGVTTRSGTPAASGTFANFRKAYDAPLDQKWQVDVVGRLAAISQLKPGWDSYSTHTPRPDAGMFALHVLNEIMRPRTPPPQVVPSSVGGIQLEWHVKGIDIELHIAGAFDCELWYRNRLTGEEDTVQISTDLAPLTIPIALISAR